MSSSSDESERDFTGLVFRCEWRRIREAYEFFDYNHRPYSGDRRGYIVESLVFLHGHGNCTCHRSNVPERVSWFMVHNDADHGRYPLHVTAHPEMIRRLLEQMPLIMRDTGFTVQVPGARRICYVWGYMWEAAALD